MTRIYIGTDIEGVAGVVHREHTARDGREHERARLWLTEEVNAAIRGAFAGGATDVVVSDGHGTGRNILRDQLDRRAKLIAGQVTSLPPSGLHGIDQSFDGMLFIGFHAKAQTPRANLDHTSWSQTVEEVRLNGVAVGETAINAALGGYFDVPLLLVSGDQMLAAEVAASLPGVRTVVVKQALSRFHAESPHPEIVHAAIETACAEVMAQRHQIAPYRPTEPITLELYFLHSAFADLAEIAPMCERTGLRTVAFTHPDYLMVHRAFTTMCALSAMLLNSNPR